MANRKNMGAPIKLDKSSVINMIFPLLIKGESIENIARICNVSTLYITNTLKCKGRFKAWCLEEKFSSKLEEVKLARPELFSKMVVHKKEHNHKARKNESQIVEYLQENPDTSCEELSEKLDISISTAYRIAKEYGYKIRTKRKVIRKKNHKSKLQIANGIIHDLQKAGIMIEEITTSDSVVSEMIVHLRHIPLSKKKWEEIVKKLA